MKQTKLLSLAAAAVLVVSMAGSALAAETSMTSKDAGKLNAEISMLNSDANMPQGDKIIAKQLGDTFKVGSDKITSLLNRNLKHGDVAALLAFAEKMPGGVTDANISKIVDMYQRTAGWDKIASNLNLDTASVASKLNSFENDAHKSIKQAFADSLSSGSAAGGMDMNKGMSESGAGGTGSQPQTPGEMYGVPGSGGAAGGSDSGISGEGAGGKTNCPPESMSGEGTGGSEGHEGDMSGGGTGGSDSSVSGGTKGTGGTGGTGG